MRRIQNYERMSKEGLTLSLLKSKQSLPELFNNNLDNDEISEIKKILNKLRDNLTKEYIKKIKRKQKIRKIFQKQRKRLMNILLN